MNSVLETICADIVFLLSFKNGVLWHHWLKCQNIFIVFLCSPCTNSGVKTTLKGATFVVESRTYAQIFVAKWSPTDKKKKKKKKKCSPSSISSPPFFLFPPFSFLLLFLSSSFLLTPSLVLYDCSYLTRNKYNLQI